MTGLPERADSVEQERAEQEERQRKLNEFTEMLQQAGIDPRELLATATAPATAAGAAKSKRAPRPAKYKYEEDGQKTRPVKAVCRKPLLLK